MSGRSPLIPLRFAALVRSPRGKALPLQSGPVRTAQKGLAPLNPTRSLFTERKPHQRPSGFGTVLFRSRAAMLNGLCPRRRWLPTKFHLDGVKAAALTICRIPIHYIGERNDVYGYLPLFHKAHRSFGRKVSGCICCLPFR